MMPGVVAGFPAKPVIAISIMSEVISVDGSSGYSRPNSIGSISPAGATAMPGVVAVGGDWEIYAFQWVGATSPTPNRVILACRDNTGAGVARTLPFATLTINGLKMTGFAFDYSYDYSGAKVLQYSIARASNPLPAGTIPVTFT